MKRNRLLLLATTALALSGCAAPQDTVLFVTNTSLGINVDKNPPTVNIAYDRYEGYIGPRAANGGMPPVIASIQTSGDVFSPQIKQVYATGNAASLAADPSSGTVGSGELAGLDNKIAFFGTATTIGLKVGFDETGTPDGLLFGFKRKELSVIPLATDEQKKLVYPSVLASIDTTVGTTTLKDTGLSISQYFATGRPAELLAKNNLSVQRSFATITNNAVISTLSPAQRAVAQADADATYGALKVAVEKVILAVAPNGTLDKARLVALIAKANSARPGSVNTALGDVTTVDDLRARIQDNQPVTSSLAQAADAP